MRGMFCRLCILITMYNVPFVIYAFTIYGINSFSLAQNGRLLAYNIYESILFYQTSLFSIIGKSWFTYWLVVLLPLGHYLNQPSHISHTHTHTHTHTLVWPSVCIEIDLMLMSCLCHLNVLPVSPAFTAGWPSYISFTDEGYTHYTVEHKHTFKVVYRNAETGEMLEVHTNRIEGSWKHAIVSYI